MPLTTTRITRQLSNRSRLTKADVGVTGGAEAFTELTDTPPSLTAGQYVKANAGGTALEFTALPSTPSNWTDLDDTAASITPLEFVRGNAGGTALEFAALSGIPSNWIDLNDTPGSITALQMLRGNAAGGALEFVTNLRTVKVTTTSHNAGNDNVILCDDDIAGSLMTINLPALATALVEISDYHIKKLGTTANVDIDANGAETIDGELIQTLTVQWSSLHVVAHSSGWFIV